MKRGEVLIDAYNLINGARRDQYGAPENSFPVIASFWRNYLTARNGVDVEITDSDVAVMMILLKLARAANGYKDDTWLDAAGYLGIGDDLAKSENPDILTYEDWEQEYLDAPACPPEATPEMGISPDPDNDWWHNHLVNLSRDGTGNIHELRPTQWPVDLSGTCQRGIKDNDGGITR
jgi:hypothetical protein